MPITLSCTACAKPFRARDESAGKKVKCPYCQTPVLVPAPDGAGAPPDDAPIVPSASRPGASRADLPLPPVSRPGASRADLPLPPVARAGASRAEVALPPPAPKVASPDDWGTAPPEPPPPSPAAKMPAPFPVASAQSRPRPGPAKSPLKTSEESAEAVLARAWTRARRGLGWVRFGLLFVVLLGFVEFGKAVYVAQVGALPEGDGAAWVSIEGVVNSDGPNAIPIRKEQLLDLACYGPPFLLAVLCIVFGRLVASGAPRSSGARGLFALSALLTLTWAVLLVGGIMFRQAFPDVSRYAAQGFVVALPLAEFLFLVALTACGLALKRPGAAKAVGLFGFLLALAAVAATIGWEAYAQYARPKGKDLPTAQHLMYEWAVFAGTWLVLVFALRRAAGVVRSAAREFVESVEDNAAAGA